MSGGRHRRLLDRLSVRAKIATVVGALAVIAGAVVVPTAMTASADIVPQRQTIQGSDARTTGWRTTSTRRR